MEETQKYRLMHEIHEAFTPGAPIDSKDLFAGRKKQRERVMGTIFQKGQHAILFGERGVGKTSLANTIYDFLVMMGKFKYQRARVNCSEETEFGDIWRSVFKQLTYEPNRDVTLSLEDALPDNPSPENIKETFQLMSGPSIVVIDELDRLGDPDIQTRLADTIKTLSDNAIDTTLILVGVADTIEQLIAEHESIQRALVQVPMQRMSKAELLEIVDKGLFKCEPLIILPYVRERIADYSHGLPFYAHLLAREAALNAVDAERTVIVIDDLEYAVKQAVDSQLESMLGAYNRAVSAPRGNNYKPVLLACALALKNEQRMFFARDVMEPLRCITTKIYKVPAFAKHLKEFCEETHGPILERRGPPRKVQYRFIAPLMEPYVILRGLAENLIKEAQLIPPSERSTAFAQLSLLPPASDPAIEL
ncbi:putative DNA-binding protein [Acidisarcina polymorpha]|uniref:Putative DNA-binding protein n=1 Tax=Acidisarcina polymorpha TaxID=2211140 RepID=A0A2Z5G9R1_9BACT|nr:ATP-binding protein [Acidisarcina polymorpha]AXC15759.1 putative DNA-binding protein [Acidisarcina polymorpha]